MPWQEKKQNQYLVLYNQILHHEVSLLCYCYFVQLFVNTPNIDLETSSITTHVQTAQFGKTHQTSPCTNFQCFPSWKRVY